MKRRDYQAFIDCNRSNRKRPYSNIGYQLPREGHGSVQQRPASDQFQSCQARVLPVAA